MVQTTVHSTHNRPVYSSALQKLLCTLMHASALSCVLVHSSVASALSYFYFREQPRSSANWWFYSDSTDDSTPLLPQSMCTTSCSKCRTHSLLRSCIYLEQWNNVFQWNQILEMRSAIPSSETPWQDHTLWSWVRRQPVGSCDSVCPFCKLLQSLWILNW